MYLQSIKSVKHNAAKSVNRSIFEEKPTYRVRCLYSSFVHGGGGGLWGSCENHSCFPLPPAPPPGRPPPPSNHISGWEFGNSLCGCAAATTISFAFPQPCTFRSSHHPQQPLFSKKRQSLENLGFIKTMSYCVSQGLHIKPLVVQK
jgi:hypothetical protein